jgi:hypothetical protein
MNHLKESARRRARALATAWHEARRSEAMRARENDKAGGNL